MSIPVPERFPFEHFAKVLRQHSSGRRQFMRGHYDPHSISIPAANVSSVIVTIVQATDTLVLLVVLVDPHCLDSRFTDGGKVVSLKHLPRFAHQKHYFYASGTKR
jgi:hypothetical protein